MDAFCLPLNVFTGITEPNATKYEADEFDCFAVYCPDNDEIYVVPTLGELAEGRLQITETKNGQQQNVRWAQEFTFADYVKSLKEKFGREA